MYGETGRRKRLPTIQIVPRKTQIQPRISQIQPRKTQIQPRKFLFSPDALEPAGVGDETPLEV
jgi:hypothetical protein